RRGDILEVTERYTVVSAHDIGQRIQTDILADEADRSITEDDMRTARVHAVEIPHVIAVHGTLSVCPGSKDAAGRDRPHSVDRQLPIVPRITRERRLPVGIGPPALETWAEVLPHGQLARVVY